jgi:hypothetical protein
VIVDTRRLSEEEVEEEFKDLVDENWDWQVRQLSESDFLVVLPSKESPRIAIRGGGLTLPTSKLKALITVPTGDPLAVDRMLMSTRELGRPVVVDVDSLDHPLGPIRMSFGCREPVQVQEFVTIFINMQGYLIRVEREAAPPSVSPPHAPPPAPAKDCSDDNEETYDDRWDGRRGRNKKKRKALPGLCPSGRCRGPEPQIGGFGTRALP